MKTKSIILSAIFAVFTLSVFSQLKVDQYGRIGMGTNWPNPGYKCHIKGDLLLTTYPATPFIELQFKVGNSAVIGTNVDEISFWSSWVNYNKLFAESYFQVSDKSFKTNLTKIKNPLRKINALKAYKYDFIDKKIKNNDSITQLIPKYGFISQEVKKVLNNVAITKNKDNVTLMDYNQIIPLLVAGMQKQQKLIDSLANRLDYILQHKYKNVFQIIIDSMV